MPPSMLGLRVQQGLTPSKSSQGPAGTSWLRRLGLEPKVMLKPLSISWCRRLVAVRGLSRGCTGLDFFAFRFSSSFFRDSDSLLRQGKSLADGDFRSEDPSDESLTAVVVVVMWLLLALFRLLSDACETLLEDVDLCRARRNRSRIAIVVFFFISRLNLVVAVVVLQWCAQGDFGYGWVRWCLESWGNRR